MRLPSGFFPKPYRPDYRKAICASTWSSFCDKHTSFDKNDTVIIDLSNLSWISLPEAIGISLIAASARRNGHILSVVYPVLTERGSKKLRRAQCRVFNYLRTWNVCGCLDSCAGEHAYYDKPSLSCYQGSGYDVPLKENGEPRMPIQEIHDTLSIDRVCKILQPDFGSKILGSRYPSEYEVAISGQLSSVVAFELLQNVAEHAFGKAIDELPENESQWCKGFIAFHGKKQGSLLGSYPQETWEKRYFERIDGKGFLRIAVGDNGLGINNTLRETFLSQHGFSEKDYVTDKNQMERDLLRWAFTESSTRKNGKKSGAYAGLSRVYRTVQRYNGLLSVCTNGLRMVVDFGEDSSNPITEFFDIHGDFDGTLYDIVFPYQEDNNKQPRLFESVRVPQGIDSRPHVEVVRICSNDDQIEIRKMLAQANENSLQGDRIVAVDLVERSSGWDKHWLNGLVEAICELDTQVGCILMGANPVVCDMITDAPLDEFLKGRLILAVFPSRNNESLGDSLDVRWLGADPESLDLLVRIFQADEDNDFLPVDNRGAELLKNMAEANPRFIATDAGADGVGTSFAFDDLSDIVMQIVSDALKDAIRCSINEGDKYFVISGNYTTNQFIFTDSILSESHVYALSRYAIRSALDVLRADGVLIGISRKINSMLDSFKQHFDDVRGYDSLVACLEGINNQLVSEKNVYVVLDLIGTGNSAQQIADTICKCGGKPKGLIAVIDTRVDTDDKIGFTVVKSLCRFPTQKHQVNKDFFSKNGSAEKMYFINSDFEVVRKGNEITTLLDTKEDFRDLLVKHGSIVSAHKRVRGDRELHHPYYIDPTRPFNIENEDGSARIEATKLVAQVMDVFKKSALQGYGVDTIVYPLHEETERLIGWIKTMYGSINFLGIDTRNFTTGRGIEQLITGRRVLIVDTGTIHGTTIQKIGSSVAKKRPSALGYFVILNRLNEQSIKSILERIDYDSSSLFVVGYDIEEPCFGADECPLCNVFDEYSALLTNGYSSEFAQNKAQAIVESYKERTVQASDVTPLFWQRLKYWGMAKAGNIDGINHFLNGLMSGSEGEDSEEIDNECGRLLNVLYLVAHLNPRLRDKFGSDHNIVGVAEQKFQKSQNEKVRYRSAKMLSFCAPSVFCREVEIFLSRIGSLSEDEITKWYFPLVDGMRDLANGNMPELRRLLDLVESASGPAASRLSSFLLADGKVLGLDGSDAGRLSDKRDFWERYYGESGPAHCPAPSALKRLVPSSGEVDDEPINYRASLIEVIQLCDEIWGVADSIKSFIPKNYEELTEEESDSCKSFDRVVAPVVADALGQIKAIASKDTILSEDVETVANAATKLLSLLYYSDSHANNVDGELVGVGYDTVCVEFPSIKNTLIEVITSDPQRDRISYNAVNDSKETIRALADKNLLLHIFRELIANAISYSRGTITVECDLTANPAKILIINQRGGFSSEELKGHFSHKGFLYHLVSGGCVDRGCEVRLANSIDTGAATVTVFLEYVKEERK